MAKTRKTVILSQEFFSFHALDGVIYQVEEKVKNRWRTVANGKFNDRESASRFAADYSANHPGIPVRVIALN